MTQLRVIQELILVFVLLMVAITRVPAFENRVKIKVPKKYIVVHTKIEGSEQFGKRWNKLIKTRISSLDRHYISDQEWESIIDQKREIVKNKLLQEFENLQEDLARIQLRQRSNQAGKRYEIFLKLKKIGRQLVHLKNKLKIKPVDFLTIENIDLDKEFTDNFTYIQPEISMWFYGRASQPRPGIYYLDYQIFNVHTNETVPIIQKTFSEKDVPKIVNIAVQKIRTILHNRPWASLTLKSKINTSKYYLGGEEVRDPKILEVLRPGSYELVVKTPGHETETQIVDLKPYENLTLEFTPLTIPENIRSINSNPQGAQVFLDGAYMGKTPLSLIAGKNQILHINHSDYRTTYATITKKEELFFTLVPKTYDMEFVEKKIRRSRNLFYTSFGIFVTSLIAPITMYSFYSDFKDRTHHFQKRGNILEATKSKAISNNYGFSLIGTSALSTGLFGWSIFQLLQYTSSVSS